MLLMLHKVSHTNHVIFWFGGKQQPVNPRQNILLIKFQQFQHQRPVNLPRMLQHGNNEMKSYNHNCFAQFYFESCSCFLLNEVMYLMQRTKLLQPLDKRL